MQIIDRLHARARDPRRPRRRFPAHQGVHQGQGRLRNHYYITTFFCPRCASRTPASTRRSCAPRSWRRARRTGEHLLVYQTATSNAALPEILARTGLECRIYGMRRDLRGSTCARGNLRYRPFSEAGFIDDLRTARGVMASAGFTLMGEAVYLRKPMLAIPVRNQLEQVMNARYLEAEGYGLAAPGRSPRSAWAPSSSGSPTSSASSPAIGRTATPRCSARSNWGSRRQRRSVSCAKNENGPDVDDAGAVGFGRDERWPSLLPHHAVAVLEASACLRRSRQPPFCADRASGPAPSAPAPA